MSYYWKDKKLKWNGWNIKHILKLDSNKEKPGKSYAETIIAISENI